MLKTATGRVLHDIARYEWFPTLKIATRAVVGVPGGRMVEGGESVVVEWMAGSDQEAGVLRMATGRDSRSFDGSRPLRRTAGTTAGVPGGQNGRGGRETPGGTKGEGRG